MGGRLRLGCEWAAAVAIGRWRIEMAHAVMAAEAVNGQTESNKSINEVWKVRI